MPSKDINIPPTEISFKPSKGETFPKIQFLSVATVIGWTGVLIVDIISLIFFNQSNFSINTTLNALALIIPYVIIGLPIAFICCYFIGLPILYIAEIFTPITLSFTVLMGLILGVIFGSINIYVLISLQTEHWKIVLDWISTVAIGGYAGYVGHVTTNPIIKPQELNIFN